MFEMKILFLMLQLAPEGKGGGMYANLAEEFAKHGHDVTVIAPDVDHSRTIMGEERGLRVLRVGSMATQGVKNMIKKGIALALLPRSYKKAYDKYLKKETFDWIFMPTPPITLSNFVGYIKKFSGAKFYLILRDIHPQSVASIGLAIGTLHTKTGEVQLDGWYTLDGTHLTGQPTRKGIYVNNGRYSS